MRLFLACIFLLCPLLIHGYAETVVSLRTEEASSPIYICPFQGKNSTFPKEYLSNCEAILRNDCLLNGKTRFLKQTKERDNLAFDQKKWAAEGAFGLIKATFSCN